jgi:hypothetical protein
MSTLTQRFLNELDTNTISMTEREKIAKQLEALTIAERELGATEYEAQRAAVQTVGKTLIPKPAPIMRLPMILQTAGIWAATSYLLNYVYTTVVMIANGHQSSITFSVLISFNVISWCFNFFIAIVATCAAIAWDRKVGFKGALWSTGVSTLISIIGITGIVLMQNAQHPMPSNMIQMIPRMMLQNTIGVTLSLLGVLVTPYIIKWWQKKKRRSL